MFCPNCGMQRDDKAVFCAHCGHGIGGQPASMSGQPSTVTVFGYREEFAAKPSVTVYCHGTRIGKVPPCGKVEFSVNGPVELRFKCVFRSAKCMVQGGDCVLLSFNRCTGKLHATATGSNNLQSAMRENEEKDQRNWMAVGKALAILGGIALAVKILPMVLALCSGAE